MMSEASPCSHLGSFIDIFLSKKKPLVFPLYKVGHEAHGSWAYISSIEGSRKKEAKIL